MLNPFYLYEYKDTMHTEQRTFIDWLTYSQIIVLHTLINFTYLLQLQK